MSEQINHFIIGNRGKFARKAMLAERVIKTIAEMMRLKDIKTLRSYVSDFKTVVHIYNYKWYS